MEGMDNRVDGSRIIYASDQCMIINKLSGEAVEGAGKGMIDLPLAMQRQFGEGAGFFAAVNRLDVPVSGCALFARNPAALASLNAAFANRRVQKYYWAIVEAPDTDLKKRGEALHWLETDRRSNKSIAFNEAAPGRKKALLRHRIVGAGAHYLFLEIELITGRRHQIRAQLAAMGLHIKGDLKYGARRSEKTGGIRLHAHSLSFPAPPGSAESGEHIMVQAPPPLRDRLWEDFEAGIAASGPTGPENWQ